jgi:hypothetical protein
VSIIILFIPEILLRNGIRIMPLVLKIGGNDRYKTFYKYPSMGDMKENVIIKSAQDLK